MFHVKYLELHKINPFHRVFLIQQSSSLASWHIFIRFYENVRLNDDFMRTPWKSSLACTDQANDIMTNAMKHAQLS